MKNGESNDFVCVQCGEKAKNLYKIYSRSVLKLCTCDHCGSVVDKYLEYDEVIILIDLILFNKEAYRHVLYNVQYKNYNKLAVLQLIVILADEYMCTKNSLHVDNSDTYYEAIFYRIFLATLIGKILFFLIILLSLYLYNSSSRKKSFGKSNVVEVWKAVICSSFGYFLLLTLLIWDAFEREIHLIFINTYILLSQIQALTVTTQVPKSILGIICIVAGGVDRIFSAFLKEVFGV